MRSEIHQKKKRHSVEYRFRNEVPGRIELPYTVLQTGA